MSPWNKRNNGRPGTTGRPFWNNGTEQRVDPFCSENCSPEAGDSLCYSFFVTHGVLYEIRSDSHRNGCSPSRNTGERLHTVMSRFPISERWPEVSLFSRREKAQFSGRFAVLLRRAKAGNSACIFPLFVWFPISFPL